MHEDKGQPAKPQQELPSLMSDSEIAAELQCSTRHVRRLVNDGQMPPPIQLGSLRRWRRATIAEWIASNCPSKQADGGGE